MSTGRLSVSQAGRGKKKHNEIGGGGGGVVLQVKMCNSRIFNKESRSSSLNHLRGLFLL